MIIDPISSYYGCNANKADEVKPVLDGITEICEQTQVTFLLVAHTTKRSDVDALQSLGGATEAGGTYRSGWTFDTDPDGSGNFLMTSTKGNYAKDKSGLKFKTVGRVVKFKDGKECEYPKIEWLGKTDMKSQDVMDTKKDNQNARKDTKTSLAKGLILSSLPLTPPELFELARKEGITRTAVYEAKKELELEGIAIHSEQVGTKNERRWWLETQWKEHLAQQLAQDDAEEAAKAARDREARALETGETDAL